MKTAAIKEIGQRDFTYEQLELIYWCLTEIWIIVIAACIPTLQPLFRSRFTKPQRKQIPRSGPVPPCIEKGSKDSLENSAETSVHCHFELEAGECQETADATRLEDVPDWKCDSETNLNVKEERTVV